MLCVVVGAGVTRKALGEREREGGRERERMGGTLSGARERD